MQTICEHCNAKKEHLYLMTLPCGFVVCYDHLKSLHETGSRNYYANSREYCFMCNNSCCTFEKFFQMAKNKPKLSEIKFLEQLSMVKSKINTIENYQNDADNYLDKYLDPIIDESYFKLMDEVKEIKANFKEKTGTIRLDKKQLEMMENCENKNFNERTKYFNDKLNLLKNFENNIDTTYAMIDSLKSIDFEYISYPQSIGLSKFGIGSIIYKNKKPNASFDFWSST
ncbi:hypothetical protein BpHYR1_000726 [Brachionus plicatilis]|uniref:Uncharacterized protein n=1 Tax=Brachionus plicatilis TaxID=10195 RepID=A0A3M7PCB3_BRAPC|nr:hypothetical protein BpHYR1_000726 [Brachionus plicatilis]